MPLNPIAEGLPLILRAADVLRIVEANIAAMPPKASRNAVDYGKVAGVDPAGPLGLVLQLIDDTEAAIKS